MSEWGFSFNMIFDVTQAFIFMVYHIDDIMLFNLSCYQQICFMFLSNYSLKTGNPPHVPLLPALLVWVLSP